MPYIGNFSSGLPSSNTRSAARPGAIVPSHLAAKVARWIDGRRLQRRKGGHASGHHQSQFVMHAGAGDHRIASRENTDTGCCHITRNHFPDFGQVLESAQVTKRLWLPACISRKSLFAYASGSRLMDDAGVPITGSSAKVMRVGVCQIRRRANNCCCEP